MINHLFAALYARCTTVLSVFAATVLIASCSGSADAPTAPVFTIDVASASMQVGGNFQLSARNAIGTVVWTTSNPAVATVVSTGYVTGVGPGSATITASVGTKSASSVVTVIPLPAIGLASSTASFTARAGSGNPAAQTVAITNVGGGTLQGLAIADVQYGVGQPGGWLTASLSGTAVTASQPGSLQMVPATAGLPTGVYTADVFVSGSGASNTPQKVTVTFTVTAPPTIELSSTSVQFAAVSGAANPAAAVISATSAVAAQATGLTATIAYTETAQAGWLTATLNTTTTPATVTLQAAAGARPTGTYNATVTLSSPDVAGTPRTVRVAFNVAPPPSIGVSSAALTFGAALGVTSPAAQSVQITNEGGGTLSGMTATVQYTTGAGWLTASLNTGTAPATLTVQPSIVGLTAGTYTAMVRLTAPGAANTPRDIAVTFTVSGQPTIAVSPTAVTFASTGATPAAQTVAVSNSGGGTLTGLSTTVQYASGAGWLTASLNSTSAPATLTLQPNTAGLAVGSYSATVTVASSVAGIASVTVPVTLTIAAAPSIVLSASALSFTAILGDADPAATGILISNGSVGTLSGLSTSVAYTSGSGWLTASLNTTTAPATLSLSASRGSLPVGTYTATVSISAPTASNTPKTVAVTMVVTTPTIVLGASASTLSRASGTGSTVSSVAIANGTGGTLSGLSATILNYAGPAPNSGWLTASLNTTTAPALVTLTANSGTSGSPMAPGTYTATVRIASAVAGNSPQDISVTFNVLVSLANNIFPGMNGSCIGCHYAGGAFPDLSTATAFRNNMVGVNTRNTGGFAAGVTYNKLIVAGDATQSYLMYQLNKSAGAYPMPTSAASQVSQGLRDLMVLWINQGANNN